MLSSLTSVTSNKVWCECFLKYLLVPPQKKVRILQSYVNDLCDQNQLLVQTVEDLEKESTERITSLERELRISDKTITVSPILSMDFISNIILFSSV